MPDQIKFLNPPPPFVSTHALLAFSEVTGSFILLGIGDFPMQVPVDDYMNGPSHIIPHV